MRNEIAIALLIVLVIASAGAGYYVGNSSEHTTTSVSTRTIATTSTVFLSITTASTVVITGNSSSALLMQCSRAETPTPTGLLFGKVIAGTRTPAIICVQFYYFNSTAPTTLPISVMIQAAQPNRAFSGDSNFTISASENQLVFGGPQEENEGAVVAFAVTAKPGTSGTYELSFSGNYMLASTEPVECPYYGTLVAGNGQPLYVFPTGCLSYITSGTNTSSLPTIQGVQYPILTNTRYFRVVGVINSTG